MSNSYFCLVCGARCEDQLFCQGGACTSEIGRALDERLQRRTPVSRRLAYHLKAYLDGGEAAVLALLGTADLRQVFWIKGCLDILVVTIGEASLSNSLKAAMEET